MGVHGGFLPALARLHMDSDQHAPVPRWRVCVGAFGCGLTIWLNARRQLVTHPGRNAQIRAVVMHRLVAVPAAGW
jgi:hypothetical protein